MIRENKALLLLLLLIQFRKTRSNPLNIYRRDPAAVQTPSGPEAVVPGVLRPLYPRGGAVRTPRLLLHDRKHGALLYL